MSLQHQQPTLFAAESQRIMAVLEEVQEKIQLLSYISTDLDYTANIASLVGDDVAGCLEEQRYYEQQYMELETERQNLDPQEDYERLQDIAFEMRETGKNMKNATRTLCRLLVTEPQATEMLRGIQNVRSHGQQVFLKTVRELKDFTYKSLVTTVDEEKEQQQFYQRKMAEFKQASETLKQLQQEASELRRERDEETSLRKEVIATLKEENLRIKNEHDERMAALKKDSQLRKDSNGKTFSEKEGAMAQQIEKLEQKLEEKLKANREVELQLRKRTRKHEIDVEGWILKYDQAMMEKQQEIETLQSIYANEKKQLHEMQEAYSQLNDKRMEIRREQERILHEERMRNVEERRHRIAASRIQAAFRAYMARHSRRRRRRRGRGRGSRSPRRRTSRSSPRRSTRRSPSRSPSRGRQSAGSSSRRSGGTRSARSARSARSSRSSRSRG